MDTPVVVALLAGTVTAAGWLVTHVLSGRREMERHRTEASLAYVESQLRDLYGPLVFSLYEGRQAWEDFLSTVGRRYLTVEGRPVDDEEVQTWLFWVESLFMPRNEQILNLLMTKTHLIEGPSFPGSYVQFLNHHNSWKMKHSRWKSDGVAYSWHSNVDWPEAFEREVISTFETLKRRHAQLLGKLS